MAAGAVDEDDVAVYQAGCHAVAFDGQADQVFKVQAFAFEPCGIERHMLDDVFGIKAAAVACAGGGVVIGGA